MTSGVEWRELKMGDTAMPMPLRPGSLCAIAGAILLMVGTALHPLGADPSDAVAAFTEYAADGYWIATHIGQFVGVALMFIGWVALGDSLKDGLWAWLARLGVLVGVAALATTAVLQAVDGVALKVLVDAWASAAEEHKQSAFQAALAARQIEVGVASFVALLFGTVFIFFGIAIVLSNGYPRWLGWVGSLGGFGTVAGGILVAFTGFSATAMNVVMPFNLILVIWMVLIGVLMWRRASQFEVEVAA